MADTTIDTDVFRPEGYASIWLFVTQDETADRTQDQNMLQDDTLKWDGQMSGQTDELIITHRKRELELLVFYRKTKHEFEGYGFRYEGKFEYVSHTGHAPTHFVLRRMAEQETQQDIQSVLKAKLSVRAYNVLGRLGVVSWADLQGLTEEELMCTRNCGTTTTEEILRLRYEVVPFAAGAADDTTSVGHQDIRSISKAKLSVRAYNVLGRLGVVSWADLQGLTVEELVCTRNCGTITTLEILRFRDEMVPSISEATDNVTSVEHEDGSAQDRTGAGGVPGDPHSNSYVGNCLRDVFKQLSTEAKVVLRQHNCPNGEALQRLSLMPLLADDQIEIHLLAEILQAKSRVASALGLDGVDPSAVSFSELAEGILGSRALNVLETAGVAVSRHLLALSEEELLSMRQCGEKTCKELLAFQASTRSQMQSQNTSREEPATEAKPTIDVNLSTRAQGILQRLGLRGIGSLIALTEADLLAQRDCGTSTVKEILYFRQQVIACICGERTLEEFAATYSIGLLAASSGLPDVGEVEGTTEWVWHHACLQAIAGGTIKSLLSTQRDDRGASGDGFALWLAEARQLVVAALSSEMEEGCTWPREQPENSEVPRSSPLSVLTGALARVCKNRRDFGMLLGRLGMLGRPRETLDELGERFDLTRERVRQIEMHTLGRLMDDPDARAALTPLIDSVIVAIRNHGGIASTDDLIASVLTKGKHGELLRYAQPVMKLLSHAPSMKEHGIVYNNKLFSVPDSDDFIEWVSERLPEIAAGVAEERLGDSLWSVSSSALRQALLGECQSSEVFAHVRAISDAAIKSALEYGESDLRWHGDRVLSHDLWEVRRGTRMDLVSGILRRNTEPMSVHDMLAEAIRLRPNDDRITERNIRAWMDRSENIVTWSRGHYLHTQHINVPARILADVERKLLSKLRRDIPFYSVNGIYAESEETFAESGVPSPVALYSCLRLRDDSRLAFPRYPYVVLNGEQRITVAAALEEFASDVGGRFSLSELRYYICDQLGISESLLGLHIYDIPSVIRVGDGEYCHLRHVNFDRAVLKELEAQVERDLQTHSMISVQGVFESKLVTCLAAGLKTPELLYSLLQDAGTGVLGLPGYPRILLAGADTETSVRDELADYVRGAARPCSYEELEEEFVTKRGFRQAHVRSAVQDNALCRYAPGTLVHIDTIGWSLEAAQALRNAADNLVEQARRAGRPYQYVSNLIDSPQLPPLSGGLPWTQALLVDRLEALEEYAVLGTGQNVFVPVPNDTHIDSFGDLIHYVLQSEFGGAVRLTEFEDEMRKRGILKQHLTQTMMGDNPRVMIRRNTVMLKELT